MMKLSLVFELLMIFVLLAFAASKSVKHRKNHKKGIQNKAQSSEVDLIEDNSINKYCKCVEAYCNCCRDFSLPLVNLNGPGCASLMYLNGDKMAVSLSFGKKVITNRTLSSRKPSPVCMPLPGGLSKFCGRVYNIARTGEEFRACLGLELQSKSIVEAAVRVSCFKFGAKGVTSEPADPLPLIPDEKGGNDDDDDDDDDYGLGGDDDDDDEEADDDEEESELEAVNNVGETDYTGFSLLEDDLLGDLFGSSGGKKANKNKNKNKKKQAPAPSSTTTTTKRPTRTRRPSSRRPSTRTTPRPTRTTTVRVRPVNNRRPTRRPNRPNRRPTRPTTAPAIDNQFTPSPIAPISPLASIVTMAPISTSSIVTTPPTVTTAATFVSAPVTAKIQPIENMANDQTDVASEDTFEPIIALRPQSTTPKIASDFGNTGLEMSLAHITGQLSSMPVIPLANEPKDSGAATKPEEQVTYQKVETITPKAPTTLPMEETSANEAVNDDMIQIVQTLDSSEETVPVKQEIIPEESRAHFYSHPVSGEVLSEAFKDVPKKKQRGSLDLPDLDVLDLTQIGETIGDELGIFDGKKRQIRGNKDPKVKDGNDDYSEYDDVIDTMKDALLLSRNSNLKTNKKRGRQNKMMRGDWSLV